MSGRDLSARLSDLHAMHGLDRVVHEPTLRFRSPVRKERFELQSAHQILEADTRVDLLSTVAKWTPRLNDLRPLPIPYSRRRTLPYLAAALALASQINNQEIHVTH